MHSNYENLLCIYFVPIYLDYIIMGNTVLKPTEEDNDDIESDLEYNERMSYMDENPLSLSIPYALISRRILNNRDLALRLRISYFSDTEGFIRVLDQYIPLN